MDIHRYNPGNAIDRAKQGLLFYIEMACRDKCDWDADAGVNTSEVEAIIDDLVHGIVEKVKEEIVAGQ